MHRRYVPSNQATCSCSLYNGPMKSCIRHYPHGIHNLGTWSAMMKNTPIIAIGHIAYSFINVLYNPLELIRKWRYPGIFVSMRWRVPCNSQNTGQTDVFGEFDLSCHEASCTAYLLLLSCLLNIGYFVSVDHSSYPWYMWLLIKLFL